MKGKAYLCRYLNERIQEMAKITVLATDIHVVSVNNEDYICITDMLKAKDGDFFISDWLRNRNTLEYLGIWERLYNPDFNYGEFATIRNQAGLNSFKISVKEYEVTLQHERLVRLNRIAIGQMQVLEDVNRKYLR